MMQVHLLSQTKDIELLIAATAGVCFPKKKRMVFPEQGE
jgi:hypothetical protein